MQGAGAGRSFIIWKEYGPAVVGRAGYDLTNAVLDGFTIICESSNGFSALHIDGPHEKQIISNNVISNSVGWYHGGGIYIADGATPTIINNVFVSNTLLIGQGYGEGGGAIYIKDASPIISGNTFIDNYAKNGGAIAVLSQYDEVPDNATIINNTFISNTAKIKGGAIYLVDTSPSICGNNIFSNTAPLGGGIYANGDVNSLIQNNQIEYNGALSTNSTGAGIAILNGGAPKVDSNIIRYNRAELGGGVHVQKATPRVTNNVLAGNYPAEIFIGAASPHIANNTIVGTQNPNAIGIDLLGSSGPSTTTSLVILRSEATKNLVGCGCQIAS